MEKWGNTLLYQGEVFIMVSSSGHHGLPLYGRKMQGCTPWTPNKRLPNLPPNPPTWTPSLTRSRSNF